VIILLKNILIDSADEALTELGRDFSSTSLTVISEQPFSLTPEGFDFLAMATNGFLGSVMDLFNEFVLFRHKDDLVLQGNVFDLASFAIPLGSSLRSDSSMHTHFLSASLLEIGFV